MLLVADSGSTKCDWVLLNEKGERIETSTMGFNPFFHDSALVEKAIRENNVLMQNAAQIKKIRFFSAGASNAGNIAILERALKAVFNTGDIQVDHDLKGAAIACTQGMEGIVCILGTGSNSCYFDGTDLSEKLPALGYILGDEGGGAYFGKQIATKYLYKKMPAELVESFENEFGATKDKILESVYTKLNANVYLASLMKFAHAHKDHVFFKEMIYKGLSQFVSIHVWCYDNFREVPVHFVGSVAYHFKDLLEEVAKNYRFSTGNIIQKPIHSLVDYYAVK